MKKFSRTLKMVGIITLFFFSWSYLPLFQLVAYAASQDKHTIKAQPQKTGKQQAVEKLERLLDDLRADTSNAEEKAAKGADTSSEVESIKARKIDLDAIDTELKEEFASTEQKLKSANLPKDILARHYKFVKIYEANIAELKANIEAIEKAKTPSALKAEVAKARTHLDKVKPGKKYVPVNPNKLPHRTAKLKERVPRLKNEEFDRNFSTQRKQKRQGIAYNDWLQAINRSDRVQLSRKPILLAFNDSFTDLPLPMGAGPSTSIHQDSKSLLLLAQATRNSPSQADLAETPEIQFTSEIKAKAQELGYKPVKIYEWVRNNIDYQPYYGSFKGAQQTLLEGSGNDFDQASLLIALLRVSQIEARYAYGTIEVPVEKVMNWVGGVTDPRIAGAILATKGIPAKLIIVGGVVKYIQLEHTWVEAWINYIPSRGAVHRTGRGDTWIPLDASYKQFTYKQGMDMYAQLGFNGEQFLQSYITDTRDITAYQDYGTRLVNYIDTNYPNASAVDIFGADEIKLTKTIVKQEFPFLLGTLPYKVIAKAAQFDELADMLSYSVTIQIDNDSTAMINGLSYSGSLNNLADKRVTVSYEPATTSDEAVVARYDGNLLSVPPYLINVKPVLRVNGSVVSTGGPVGLGKDQNIVISFSGPDGDTDRVQNVITAGAYSAIILQSQDTPIITPNNSMMKLIGNSKNLDSPSVTLDDLLGQMLYAIGLSYFQKISFENDVYAKTLQLINLRLPSQAMVSHTVKVNYLFGLPRTISEGGVNIDVDRNAYTVFSLTQEAERVKAFMTLSGLSSSVWEDRMLNAFFDVSAVSSVRILKLASQQNIPIFTITSANINDILPQLEVEAEVKTDIMNAINAGKKVIVSKTAITSGHWRGVGYIVIDPITGAAGYQISGGLSGGDCDYLPVSIRRQPQFVFDYWRTFWIRGKALKLARAYIGTPYVWGGKLSTSDDGFDCSGFVQAVSEGVSLPEGNAANQYNTCQTKDWLRPEHLVTLVHTVLSG